MSDAPSSPRSSLGEAVPDGAGGVSAGLMRRVQAGDEPALGALMEEWERPVKALIARIVLNTREAEELAQETFVRVWQHRGKFRAGAAFRPWLFAIAVNLARNRLRWWRRRPEVSLEEWSEVGDRGSGIEKRTSETGRRRSDSITAASGGGGVASGTEPLERAERAAAVREAIAALPVELREALVLFEYEQLSHAEIATALGTTPKAVETRLYRARDRLRKALVQWA